MTKIIAWLSAVSVLSIVTCRCLAECRVGAWQCACRCLVYCCVGAWQSAVSVHESGRAKSKSCGEADRLMADGGASND